MKNNNSLPRKLTNKREAWIREYLVCWNATEAARRVGFGSPNTQGPRLLLDVSIREEIKRILSEKLMSSDEVLTRLADIARGDLADLMDVAPSGFTLQLMTKDENGNLIVNPKTKLIKKIKQKVTTRLAKNEDQEDSETIETEIELYSAHDALRDLGRYHALFTDKTDLTSGGDKITVRIIEDDTN
jgi:phage terminase small subunit